MIYQETAKSSSDDSGLDCVCFNFPAYETTEHVTVDEIAAIFPDVRLLTDDDWKRHLYGIYNSVLWSYMKCGDSFCSSVFLMTAYRWIPETKKWECCNLPTECWPIFWIH